MSAPVYQHWNGRSTGIWRRRATITWTGIRLCWSSKLLRGIFAVAWLTAFGLTAFYFLVSQLLTPDSALTGYLMEHLGPRPQRVLTGIASWLLLYPDVAADSLFRTTLFLLTQMHVTLSFLAVLLFVPKLISHDLSSQAILIYNSKALTHRDYIIGKFGVIAGLLAGISLLPLIFAWFVGNLVSPDWSFFYYGFPALLRALTFTVLLILTLSLLGLAASSFARRTATATALWALGWIISGLIAQGVGQVIPWGRFISPGNCLKEMADHLFDLKGVLENSKAMLPFFDVLLQSIVKRPAVAVAQVTAQGSIGVPLAFLGAFCALGLVAVFRRTRL